ncbi:MAG TPA: alpha/beta hydrolase [Candidatus Limnocylindrales bacterium]|nr:alpha/beta hydrolase [Candidatus Limnocylindrales bacterium]
MAGSLLDHPGAEETGFADSDGVRIAWRAYGDGPETILFLPTWNFVDSRVVRHQVDGLRDRFRVITFDARGSGDSDHPPTGYRFDDHMRDAVAVMDATNMATMSIVAASRGMHVAVPLAIRNPDRVLGLVLVVPSIDLPGDEAPAPPADLPDIGDEPDWTTDYEAFVRWFISACFPEPSSETTIAEIVEIALDADRAMLVQQADELDWDQAPRLLAGLRCPTLVIHGAADPTVDVASVKAVAAAIPGAELALLEGLGHRPDISRPDIVNPLIADFVSSRAGAPSAAR